MRAALLALVILIAAAPARADVRVIDAASGASRVVLADDQAQLVGWTDDGAGLLLKRDGVQRLGLADGMLTPQPARLADAVSIGPGGRTVALDGKTFSLAVTASDGRVVAKRQLESIWIWFEVAWSRDGGRVAISGPDRLAVIDTATGATLLERTFDVLISEQAFSPDGSALLATTDGGVVRIDVATGARTTLHRSKALPRAAWGPDGRIAITLENGIAVMGLPTIRVHASDTALWSADGTLLRFFASDGEACSFAGPGLSVVAPGQAPRTLTASDTRTIGWAAWSPVGASLAVTTSPTVIEPRGKRRPWPKRVAREYFLSARGNATMRRIVLRAARDLKAGKGREETLQRVRIAYVRAADRYGGAMDTIVRERVGDQLDRWLIAAGFEPIEAYDEITC